MDKISSEFLGGSAEILIPHYETFLAEREIKDRAKRGYLHFHPSSFGGCPRYTSFQYHSEANDKFKNNSPVDMRFRRICDAGHAFHDRMQRDLSIMGILRGLWRCKSCGEILGKENPIGIFLPDTCPCIEKKKKDKRRGIKLFEYVELFLESDPKYNFKGNCDGILEFEPGEPSTRYVIDFKTINEGGFSYLRKPDQKYITQIRIYMWLTGIRQGIIYYEDKNKHALREFKIIHDESIIDDIKLMASKLKTICEAGKIPKIPQDYHKSKKPCTLFQDKKCEYYKFCY